MSEYMKISELAGFFNLSVKALRVYEKKGIIVPDKVDEQTGYRYYSVEQVPKLSALVDLQSLGFTLNEIKSILDGSISQQEILDKIEEKKWEWQEKVIEAQHKCELLDTIENNAKAGNMNLDFKKMSEDERARRLVQMVCVEDVRAQQVLSEVIWL